MEGDLSVIVYWHWLLLGVTLAVADAFVSRFSLLWFGLSALVVGLLLLLFPALPLVYQVVIWPLLASALALAWLRHFRPRMKESETGELDRSAAIGEAGTVVELAPDETTGVVEFPFPLLGKERWDFVAEQPLAVGDRVFIKECGSDRLEVIKL